jgi:hypothetical protein
VYFTGSLKEIATMTPKTKPSSGKPTAAKSLSQ